jgi:hypothetical protein
VQRLALHGVLRAVREVDPRFPETCSASRAKVGLIAPI